MPLLPLSNFVLDCFKVGMTFGGVGLWEGASWQDFVSQTEYFDMFLVTLVPS